MPNTNNILSTMLPEDIKIYNDYEISIKSFTEAKENAERELASVTASSNEEHIRNLHIVIETAPKIIATVRAEQQKLIDKYK